MGKDYDADCKKNISFAAKIQGKQTGGDATKTYWRLSLYGVLLTKTILFTKEMLFPKRIP